jgi:enoyl-CoA hydratase/carnithine racemase
VTDALVGVQHSDGVRTLTLDSPANRNALSSRLLDDLAQALRDATTDAEVRALVLTGAGTVFCSGADLSERGSGAPTRMPEILTAIVESPVPVVAPAMILVPALRVADRRFLSRAVLTGEPFTAGEAAAAGLLTAVLDDVAALDDWVGARLESVRKSAPGAVGATKALLRSLPGQDWTEGLEAATAVSATLFAGTEAAEGMDAFLEKRKPAWDTAP